MVDSLSSLSSLSSQGGCVFVDCVTLRNAER
jgi:hypothetical protein